MRVFNRKIAYRAKTYIQKQNSIYSNRFKWRIILPEQVVFKLDDCLENNPPDFCFKQEVALYFLGQISYVSSKNKDKYYVGGFVNLNAEILKKKHKSTRSALSN